MWWRLLRLSCRRIAASSHQPAAIKLATHEMFMNRQNFACGRSETSNVSTVGNQSSQRHCPLRSLFERATFVGMSWQLLALVVFSQRPHLFRKRLDHGRNQSNQNMARSRGWPLRLPDGPQRRDHLRVRQDAHQDSQRHWCGCATRRVDPHGHHQDPHEGHGSTPKLILVGRLSGTLNGRPWSFDASGSEIMLRLSGLGSAIAAARLVRAMPSRVFSIAERLDGVVRAQVGSWPAVEVLPRPSFMARLFVPALRASSRA